MNLTKLLKGSALSALAAAMAITALPAEAEAQSRDRQERAQRDRGDRSETRQRRSAPRAERPQPHSLIKAPAGGMADAKFSAVSILSLTSLKALGEALEQDLDPRRFRGNLWIDGTAPFEEFDWVGRELKIGSTRLEVVDRITRCRATETNPDTGERDANTLKALREHWGHTDFGIRAKVLSGGDIALSDSLEVL